MAGRYRDMAKAANVALGTVDFVITELKELGFLIDMKKKGRQLLKTEQFLRRWVEAYPENLKPKLVQEKFRTDFRRWWKDIQPADFGLFWGGEIAAAEFRGYLKPEIVTVYTDKLPGKLIYKFKFQKDPNGNLEVLTPFWAFEWKLAEKGYLIEWPPDGSYKMSVTGFRECNQHAVQVKISDKPKLSVNVVSSAGLAILMLISWDENSARRQKDSSDLVFIIRNYLDAGNLERLFAEAPDIVDSGDYDHEAGSARLLGRDISKIAYTSTIV